MNEGWLNYGAEYVIVSLGPNEGLGLVTERYGERAVVRVVFEDGSTFTTNQPAAELRKATPLEIYEHGERRLKRERLGPGYGVNADKTMWDLMTDRDKDYWRSLCPTEAN